MRVRAHVDNKRPLGDVFVWLPSNADLRQGFGFKKFIWKVIPASKSEGVGKRDGGGQTNEKNVLWRWFLHQWAVRAQCMETI